MNDAEKQKKVQLPLNDIIDAKKALESNINALLYEFCEQTGIRKGKINSIQIEKTSIGCGDFIFNTRVTVLI